MNFDETINNIQEKLGKENASLIADDIASLMTYESARNNDITSKNEEISKLKKDKEMLIKANGNLLQKVSTGMEEKFNPKLPKDDEEQKPINLKNAFDKNGNFIK